MESIVFKIKMPIKTKENIIPILLNLVFVSKSSSGGFVILNNINRDKNAGIKLKRYFI